MQCLSRSPFFYKILPVLWAVVLVFFMPRLWNTDVMWFAIIFFLISGFGVFYLYRKCYGAVNQVLLNDNELVVIKRGEKVNIPLSEIVDVDVTPMGKNAPLITLKLRTALPFGQTVIFISKDEALSSKGINPVAELLKNRINALRQQSS